MAQAVVHLSRDPVLKPVIDRFGQLNYQPRKDYYETIVYSIIGQQLSSKAADTIYNRFLTLFPRGKYTPSDVLALDLEAIRATGTSWAKARSLHDLSQKVLHRTIRLDLLESMADEEVIDHLTRVKGVGIWTAQMKLMFTLHRPDVFPVNDVGIQNAFVKLYGLNRRHKTFTRRMVKIAESWRPWRTVACWYLWKSLDNQE